MAGNIFHVEFGINETELTKALERRQYKKAADLITSCTNPSYLDEGCYQRTPLYITLCGFNEDETTVASRNFHSAQLLMQHGANVNYRIPAIDFGSEYLAPGKSSLELLVDLYNSLTLHPCHVNGNLIGCQFEEQWDPMEHKVIGLNNQLLLLSEDVLEHISDLVSLLISRGGDINIRDEYQMTPLHRSAIYSQDMNVLRLLSDCGAHINSVDFRGNTPLAALCDAFPFGIKSFLEAKPLGDPYTEHNVVEGREECLTFLLNQNMADVDSRNKVGRTALFNCMVQGDIDSAATLLRYGANPCLKGQVYEDRRKPREVSPLLATLCSFQVIRFHEEKYMSYKQRSYQYMAHLVDAGYFTKEEIAQELFSYLGEELSHLRLLGTALIHKVFGGTTASLRQLCARQIFLSTFVNNLRPNGQLFPQHSPLRSPLFNLNHLEQAKEMFDYAKTCVNVSVLETLIDLLHLPRDTLLPMEIELFRFRLTSQVLQYQWFHYHDDEIDGVHGNSYHSDEYPSDEDDSDLEYW